MPHWKQLGDPSGSSVTTTPWSDDFLLAANAAEAIGDKLGAGATGSLLFAATTAAAARAIIAVGSGGLVSLLPAAGVSPGSTYEITGATEPGGPGLLQLKRVKTFPTSRSIAAASPEYGWIWQNRTTWAPSSANDNTTNAGESTWAFSTTSVTWFSSTTAPFRYRVINVGAGDVLEVVCRVASNGQRNYELAGILVALDSNPAKWSRLLMGYDLGIGGTNIGVNSADTANQKGNTALTSTDRDAGVWLKIRWTSEGFRSWYSTSTSATVPTSWTATGGGALTDSPPWGNGGAALRVGMMAQNENTSGGFVVKWKHFEIRLNNGLLDSQPWQWGTELFSTSGVEQLVAEVDFGVSVSLNQTSLRAALVDAVNARPWDTATVTLSLVSSSTTGPASGTYYAANALVVPSAGRYYRLYVKITSATGAEQGSFDLRRVFLPVA